MVDIVISIAAKVGEYLVAPVGRQLGSLFHYNSNITELQDEAKKLGDKRQSLQLRVDEAKRKGEGAARFKQGLGFSSESSTTAAPSKAPSFLSNFVRASSPTKAAQLEKQTQLESIQKKKKKKKKPKSCEENS